MKWTTKVAIQKVSSFLPYGSELYYFGQKQIGGFKHFSIDGKLRQGSRLLSGLWSSSDDLSGKKAVEIGTGWVPIIPFLFWLYGQEECTTYDITRLLKDELVLKAIDQFLAKPDQLQFNGRGPNATRLDQLAAWKKEGFEAAEFMQKCHLNYLAPVDAAHTSHQDASIDLIYSNTVLEHVDPDSVHRLFQEAKRILKPDGKLLHLIDMSDHFSHGDSSITSINFLQFSDEAFENYNNKFLYQNRWRASTWRQAIERHGFEIVTWQPHISEEARAVLPSLKLDGQFASLDAEDICTSSVCLVARKPKNL